MKEEVKFCEFIEGIICEWDFCEACVISASDPVVMHKYLEKTGNILKSCSSSFWVVDSKQEE